MSRHIHVEDSLMSLVLTPGAVPLADWRRIYRDGTAAVTLDPASAGPIAAVPSR
jgi:hypothetical protein